MHFLISFIWFNFEFKLTTNLIVVHLAIGAKTLVAYEREFVESFVCAECPQEVEDDGQVLLLCEEHRQQFLEHWYNRWLNK